MKENGTRLVLLSVVSLLRNEFFGWLWSSGETAAGERDGISSTSTSHCLKHHEKLMKPAQQERTSSARQNIKAAKDTVDNAYSTYKACHTDEAIAMAQDGINKVNALCPKMALSPKVSLSAAPATVKQGKCATLTWSSTNATRVSIDQGVGNVGPSGSQQVCPGSTTSYTIAVAGEGGSQTATTTVSVTPLSAKIVMFPEGALFDFDKADLKPAGQEQLKAYREQAKAELSSAGKIKITGHTDNSGSAEHNMKLSLQRAEAVRDYLVSLGVDPTKWKSAERARPSRLPITVHLKDARRTGGSRLK